MDMNKIEKKVEAMRVRQQELCIFYADVLKNLCDENSTIEDAQSGFSLYLPVEKIDYLVNELTALGEEIRTTDAIEAMLYEED